MYPLHFLPICIFSFGKHPFFLPASLHFYFTHLQTAPFPSLTGCSTAKLRSLPLFSSSGIALRLTLQSSHHRKPLQPVLKVIFAIPTQSCAQSSSILQRNKSSPLYFCPGLGPCMCVHNQGAHSTEENCRTNGSHYATPASTLQARTCFQSPLITNATPKQNQVSNLHYVFKKTFFFFFAYGASAGNSHCPPSFFPFFHPGSCPNAHLCSSGER